MNMTEERLRVRTMINRGEVPTVRELNDNFSKTEAVDALHNALITLKSCKELKEFYKSIAKGKSVPVGDELSWKHVDV